MLTKKIYKINSSSTNGSIFSTCNLTLNDNFESSTKWESYLKIIATSINENLSLKKGLVLTKENLFNKLISKATSKKSKMDPSNILTQMLPLRLTGQLTATYLFSFIYFVWQNVNWLQISLKGTQHFTSHLIAYNLSKWKSNN